MYPNIFSFYVKNIRNLNITDLLKNAGFPEVEAFLKGRGFMVPVSILVPGTWYTTGTTAQQYVPV